MRFAWSSPTEVALGIMSLDGWCPERNIVLLLVDGAVIGQPFEVTVEKLLGVHGSAEVHRVVVTRSPRLCDVMDALEPFRRDGGAVTRLKIVAVGGGATMDLGALCSLLVDQDRLAATLGPSQRSGLMLFPRTVLRSTPLAMVPTTLGTGAELSSSACVDGEDGRRLLAGEAFRPDLAVYDDGATKTLPGYLVQEAVVEGLFRLSAVLSGELADHRLEDHLALSLTERIVQLGDEIAAQRAAGPVSADTRLELAELNGLTHMALLSFRRSRYSGKAWYVATEISSVIGVRKTQAIALFLPAVFEQMMRGQEAWGSSRRLRQFWSRVCAATRASVSDAPSQGFAQLMEQWCVEIPPLMSPEEGARVVHRSMRRWGAGLPMLYGLTSEDLFAAVALVSRTEDRQALPQAEYGSDGAVPVLIGNAPMGK